MSTYFEQKIGVWRNNTGRNVRSCSAVILAGLLLAAGTVPLASVYAQDVYLPLAPLPNAAPSGGTSLTTYLPGMFKLIIAVAAVLAVIMLIIGGFQYVTTDSIFGRSEGKKKIEDAITGLLLAIISWLILYSINPNLVQFNLNLSYERRPVAAGGTPSGGVPAGGGPRLDHNAAVALLTAPNAQFKIFSSGDCPEQNNPTCTSFTNIQLSTVEGIIALKNACGVNCTNLTITGGTEVGHETGGVSHGAGYKLDISSRDAAGAALGAYIQNRIGHAPVPDQNETFTENGYRYTVRYEPSSSHWDISIMPIVTETTGN